MRFAGELGFPIDRARAQGEATFLQDAYRRNVVGGYTGVEWPPLFQAEKRSERFAGNATPPKCAVDPVADLAFPISPKTADVPRDLAIDYDCLFQTGVVRQDLYPVLVEFRFVARTEYDHRDGHGISLMFEKDGQVVR